MATTQAPVRTRRPARKAAAPTEHPLADRIPKRWMADSYVSREFDGVRDIDVLDTARKLKWNTLIYGPTGPGKTSCVYAYGAEKGIPVINIACNGAVDPATMFVQPVWNEDGSVTNVESEVTTCIRYGGILYFDEVNSLPPRIAMVTHGLLDLRRTVTISQLGNLAIPAHADCQVIASYNPDYVGTKPLNQAFKNRFGLQLPFEYDLELEAQIVQAIPSLLDLAKMLRDSCDKGDIMTPVGPNMLLEFEVLAEQFGVDFAVSMFVNRFEVSERMAVRTTVGDHFIDRIRADVDSWSASSTTNNKRGK